MKKKTLNKIISLIMMGMCVWGSITTPFVANIYAEENTIEEEMDDEKAIKGAVRICAIFDKWNKNPVVVDLSPTFEGGVHHLYTLTPEQPEVVDMVAVGSYRTIAYLADENHNYKIDTIRVFAQKQEVVVKEDAKEEEIPSTVAIVGFKEFINTYGYELTEHRNEEGKALSGVITENEAIEICEKNVAKQNPNNNEYDNSQIQEELKPEEIPYTEDKVEEDKNGFLSYIKYIVPAFAVLGAATLIVWYKKNK